MDYGLGNMSVFFNLDLELVKKDFGIPEEVYLNPRWSLRRLGEEFDIPEKEIAGYFRPFTRFNGWIVLFRDEQFFPALFRTLAVTTVSIIGLNLLSLCTGTALAGLKHRYQIRVYNLYLMTVFIPAFLIVLPQFLIISRFTSLIPGYAEPGTTREVVQLLTLVAMYICGGALSTMIFTSYISTIPRDLEESAEIDGASRWQYMRYVLLPLCKTPVASLTVIVLPWFWNDFFTAFVYLDPRYATLLPLIQSFTGQYTTNFQVVFTGVFVSILPLLIVYLVFRRAFIKGALAGALKG